MHVLLRDLHINLRICQHHLHIPTATSSDKLCYLVTQQSVVESVVRIRRKNL